MNKSHCRIFSFTTCLQGWKFVFLVAFLLCGCRTVDLTMNDNSKFVSLNNPRDRNYSFVKHFSRDEKAYFTLFNIVTAKNVNIDNVVQQEISAGGGDGVVNLKIKGQDTFIDQIVPIGVGVIGTLLMPTTPFGFFAAYMIGMRTYSIEGDIVRYSDQEDPVKNSKLIKSDTTKVLPSKKEIPKVIEYDPDTGLPKKN
jgi:hypothetical protein